MKHSLRKSYLYILAAIALPFPIFANAGVPLLFVIGPKLPLVIVPIVLIEAAILWCVLQMPLLNALKLSAFMNVVTTIVGVPVTWVAMLILEIGASFMPIYDSNEAFRLVANTAWLEPAGDALNWMVPLATLILMVPLFFVTFYFELFVTRKSVGNLQCTKPEMAKRGVLVANLASYLLLAAILAVKLFIGMSR